MTIRQALTAAASQLSACEHLRATAGRDAELLLMHALDVPKATLFAHPDRVLSEEEEFFFWQGIHRRAADEPVQYIVGEQEFYGLRFYVSPAVLIPRPETEHLVEAVLERTLRTEPLAILDVGTGSGIIAVTLAVHLPYAKLTAVDISRDAIAIARRNAELHQVASRIDFVESDLLANVPARNLDVVVSNPPYIPEADRASLHPQVREYEPQSALFAGPEGMDIYRRLIPQARQALRPGGLLALEIGYGQRTALTDLLQVWREVSFVEDLQSIPRVVLARP